LFLGRYYAGRFAISIGNDPPAAAGDYSVLAKEQGHEYVSADGIRIPARAADNPYGEWWLDLGNNVAIHGSPAAIPRHGGRGCISLNGDDAFDVFSILSIGSKVSIR
jgi:lipoprotein-anchoring transpeptidase ErfK/SrfK